MDDTENDNSSNLWSCLGTRRVLYASHQIGQLVSALNNTKNAIFRYIRIDEISDCEAPKNKCVKMRRRHVKVRRNKWRIRASLLVSPSPLSSSSYMFTCGTQVWFWCFFLDIWKIMCLNWRPTNIGQFDKVCMWGAYMHNRLICYS